MDKENAQKAQEFLQAQQHYYRELRQHKDDLGRFQASRQEHRDAIGLLTDLPKQVRTKKKYMLTSCRARLMQPGFLVPGGVFCRIASGPM